jgi:hypothetical protein
MDKARSTNGRDEKSEKKRRCGRPVYTLDDNGKIIIIIIIIIGSTTL